MSTTLLYPLPPDLPPHCLPETPLLVFFSQTFGTCLPSYMSLFSTAAGIVSIISWLFAQMPQIWKNYRRRSVEGLSLGFLAIWLAGDICNFLGAIWTDQMWFQQAVALYYVSVDCILVSQYYYFSVIDNSATVLEGQSVRYDESIDDDNSGDSYLVDSETETEAERRRREKKSKPTWHVGGRSRSLASTLIVVVSVMGHLAGATPVGINTITDSSPLTPPNISTLQALGSVLSWFSTLLYLISRLPQLLLNYRRRSTSGLAISLFVAAFFGNLFYSLSLLLNPLGHQDYPPYGGGGLAGKDGSDHQEWWSRTLPFFVGASGVLSLDFAVSWQWLAWGERTPGGSGSDALFCSGEEEEDSAEICGMQTNWRQWWPWNGWFADTAAEMKALIGEEDRGYGTTATGSGTGR